MSTRAAARKEALRQTIMAVSEQSNLEMVPLDAHAFPVGVYQRSDLPIRIRARAARFAIGYEKPRMGRFSAPPVLTFGRLSNAQLDAWIREALSDWKSLSNADRKAMLSDNPQLEAEIESIMKDAESQEASKDSRMVQGGHSWQEQTRKR